MTDERNRLELVETEELSPHERHVASIRTRMARRDRHRALLGEVYALAERHCGAVAYAEAFVGGDDDGLVDETDLGDLFVAMDLSVQDLEAMRLQHQRDSRRRRDIDRIVDEWLKQVTPQRLW